MSLFLRKHIKFLRQSPEYAASFEFFNQHKEALISGEENEKKKIGDKKAQEPRGETIEDETNQGKAKLDLFYFDVAKTQIGVDLVRENGDSLGRVELERINVPTVNGLEFKYIGETSGLMQDFIAKDKYTQGVEATKDFAEKTNKEKIAGYFLNRRLRQIIRPFGTDIYVFKSDVNKQDRADSSSGVDTAKFPKVDFDEAQDFVVPNSRLQEVEKLFNNPPNDDFNTQGLEINVRKQKGDTVPGQSNFIEGEGFTITMKYNGVEKIIRFWGGKEKNSQNSAKDASQEDQSEIKKEEEK